MLTGLTTFLSNWASRLRWTDRAQGLFILLDNPREDRIAGQFRLGLQSERIVRFDQATQQELRAIIAPMRTICASEGDGQVPSPGLRSLFLRRSWDPRPRIVRPAGCIMRDRDD